MLFFCFVCGSAFRVIFVFVFLSIRYLLLFPLSCYVYDSVLFCFCYICASVNALIYVLLCLYIFFFLRLIFITLFAILFVLLIFFFGLVWDFTLLYYVLISYCVYVCGFDYSPLFVILFILLCLWHWYFSVIFEFLYIMLLFYFLYFHYVSFYYDSRSCLSFFVNVYFLASVYVSCIYYASLEGVYLDCRRSINQDKRYRRHLDYPFHAGNMLTWFSS